MALENLGQILNSAEYKPHRDRAIGLLESIYGPKRWPWESWKMDSRTEAVGLLLYTGALGGEAAKPDQRIDDVIASLAGAMATLQALLDRLE